jgi:DNA end-binding protein Ku
VALGKIVFTTREHIIALEARGKGLLGITLRYPYEVRKEKDYFADIADEKLPKEMLELAKHIVGTKRGAFQPQKFEDHYEDALRELLKKKQSGEKIEAPKEAGPSNVINLMDALRRSLKNDDSGPTPVASRRGAAKKSRKKPAGQTEMLLPIEGKKQARHHTKKAARSSRRQKAG